MCLLYLSITLTPPKKKWQHEKWKVLGASWDTYSLLVFWKQRPWRFINLVHHPADALKSCEARVLSFVAYSRALRRMAPRFTIWPWSIELVTHAISSFSISSTGELLNLIFFTGFSKALSFVLAFFQSLISFSLIPKYLIVSAFVCFSAKLKTSSLKFES